MYPLGNVWTHCLRNLNVSSMSPLDKCPFAPSDCKFDGQRCSLADFGTNVTNKHGCIERHVVVAVERQQKMCTEPFGVIDLECSLQSRMQIPKPIRDISRCSYISGGAKGELMFIHLLPCHNGSLFHKQCRDKPGAMSQEVSDLLHPLYPGPVAQQL